MKRLTVHDRKKLHIQRDYSKGIHLCFKTDYPRDIGHLIDEDSWTSFITELNYLYEDAEKITSRAICETMAGLFTCYLARMCYTPIGYQKMDKIDEFLLGKNKKVMVPKGLYVVNPIEKGFRALEITLLNEKLDIKQQPEIYQNLPKSPLIPR